MIQARFEPEFASWRDEARRLLLAGRRPDEVNWSSDASLFSTSELFAHVTDAKPASGNSGISNITSSAGRAPATRSALRVPPEFIELAELVSCARAPDRWELLYRLLYRLQFEDRNLLELVVDRDVHRALALKKSVSRDIHKMHAFVRFKRVDLRDAEDPSKTIDTYVAWHKAEHIIYKTGTPFFARRFGDRPWSIFTPDGSAHWDLEKLTFGPGLEQNQFEAQDHLDDVWKVYYRSIFNPARIKIKMMKSEMSPKYWSSMPEAEIIDELVREAPARLEQMRANHNTNAIVDMKASLDELEVQAKSCRACPIHARATQTIFGIGPTNADIMIVGEQPGNDEDLAGKPFVGPAGKILNDAFEAAGLERDELYLTNAVKHFKWTPEPQGKRLHQKPSGREVHACKPWLEAEIAKVRPKIIVALGTTAATAVLGRLPKITTERGRMIPVEGLRNTAGVQGVIISWHPAAILREANPTEAARRREQLGRDLALAHATLLANSVL